MEKKGGKAKFSSVGAGDGETVNDWRDLDSGFDPFQVFQVEHDACLAFEVTIIKGESITKGSRFSDFLDTPDPYVVLRIPGSSNPSRRTSHVDNCVNPMWDETFNFYLEPSVESTLKVTLMDANYTVDETLGEDTFCINELTSDVPKEHTFVFPGGSKVHTSLKLQRNKYPELRFSLALCMEEKEYLLKRRTKVLASMKSLLGSRAPAEERQVPTLGIIGSGGGFRAMTCLSGIFKALQEHGILDCATYIAGLGGSSWYMSTLYAHDQFPNITHSQIKSELRESATNGWKTKLFKSPTYLASMRAKYNQGQPVSFADFFGHLLGDVLLKGAKHKKLTDMQKFLSKCTVPFPLFGCLHAKRNVSCKSFSEWVEFSPYEVGVAKYGAFMKTQDFGSKFIGGKKINHFSELPLHFLQGVWGSTFTILFKQLVTEGGKKDILQIMRDYQKKKEIDIYDQLHEECSSEEEADTGDEEDIVGADDIHDETTHSDLQTSSASLKNQDGGNIVWTKRRESLRQQRVEKKSGLLEGLKQSIMTGASSINSNASRAGEVLNPFRGISLQYSFPISPFSVSPEEEELSGKLDTQKGSQHEPLDNSAKTLYLVDAGLAFNSPYPILLRPQRAVDIYLSFDFSTRPKDKHPNFKELILAESWAKRNKVPFPPITKMIEQYKNEEIQECYIFKNPSDHFCPVILHFPLVNNQFKTFKKPGVPRETDAEKKFADFPIFDDPNNPYSTMNFVYEPLQFDRLTEVAEFNVLQHIDTIKNELADIVNRKKKYVQNPVSISDMMKKVDSIQRKGSRSSLKLKLSDEKASQLKEYLKKAQALEQAFMESSGEFSDALEEQPKGLDGT